MENLSQVLTEMAAQKEEALVNLINVLVYTAPKQKKKKKKIRNNNSI